MKLFFSPGACSLAPHIILLEAGLKFQAEKVDLKAKTWSGGDYRKINPKGSVPAIQVDGGEVLTEGAVILQYLADQNPQSGLMPKAGTMDRYRAQEWLNYIASDIHKGFSVLFAADRWVAQSEGNEQLKASAREALAGRFGYLNDKLHGRSYLMGEHFTAPDAYLFVCLRWSKLMSIDLGKWPAVAAFMNRVQSRPKVKEAMAAEGLKLH